MERNVIVLIVVYAVLAALSLTLLVYNYRTKYCVGKRVYSNGGVVFRSVLSFVPLANLMCIFFMLTDPFGEYHTWMDKRTGKECRRARLDAWMQRHGEVKSVKPKTEEP